MAAGVDLAHGEKVETHTPDGSIPETNGRLSGSVVVVNPQGLHMRPAMAFARRAQEFASSVNIHHGDRVVNGKSLIEVMLLAAGQGTELVVEVDGNDAQAALPVLLEILAAPSADEIDG